MRNQTRTALLLALLGFTVPSLASVAPADDNDGNKAKTKTEQTDKKKQYTTQRGDLDNDGALTKRDVKHVAAYLFDGVKPPSGGLATMDVDRDGRITIGDLIALGSQVATNEEAPQEETVQFIPGDVSGDGVVDLYDLALLDAYVGGFIPKLAVLEAADVNGDGKIGFDDVQILSDKLLPAF